MLLEGDGGGDARGATQLGLEPALEGLEHREEVVVCPVVVVGPFQKAREGELSPLEPEPVLERWPQRELIDHLEGAPAPQRPVFHEGHQVIEGVRLLEGPRGGGRQALKEEALEGGQHLLGRDLLPHALVEILAAQEVPQGEGATGYEEGAAYAQPGAAHAQGEFRDWPGELRVARQRHLELGETGGGVDLGGARRHSPEGVTLGMCTVNPGRARALRP